MLVDTDDNACIMGGGALGEGRVRVGLGLVVRLPYMGIRYGHMTIYGYTTWLG